MPKEIIVEVSRVKMTFEADSLVFSSPIVKNKSIDGITLSIPVTIQTYDHRPANLNTSIVNAAGIGVNVTARLDDRFKELPEGKHVLQYALSGLVTENAYLMFDFIDTNGKIQTVSLTTPVIN